MSHGGTPRSGIPLTLETAEVRCQICGESISADDIFYTPCSHAFNLRCITEWLARSQTCPTCRYRVLPHQLRRLYVTISSRTSREGKLLSTIDDLNATITQQQNCILEYEAQLAERKKALKTTEKMSSLKAKNEGPRCSPRVTRSRDGRIENAASGIEDPVKKIDAMMKIMKRESEVSLAAAHEKHRETLKKLQEERAHISELKKELKIQKADNKVYQRTIKRAVDIMASSLPTENVNRTVRRNEKVSKPEEDHPSG